MASTLAPNPSGILGNLESVDDDSLISLYADNRAEREETVAVYDNVADVLKAEIERRLRERRAQEPAGTETIAIPHDRVEITLKAQYAPYAFDVDKLREAAKFLKSEEAAKVLVHVPEQVIPAKDIPGNTASIKAMQTLYRGSDVGKLLAEAMTHPRLEDKLTIRPITAEPKNITP